jgi:hypothetical protein
VPLPVPEAGLVISFSYLWRSEYRRGQEEGLKDRPCVIVLARRGGGQIIVTVVPVTHSPPTPDDVTIELHATTKARLGLDEARSWVVVSEVNQFVWPGPDLRPVSRNEPDRFDYGMLPPSMFDQIIKGVVACSKAQRLAVVPRS